MKGNAYPPATKGTHCFDPCSVDVENLRTCVPSTASGCADTVGDVLDMDGIPTPPTREKILWW